MWREHGGDCKTLNCEEPVKKPEYLPYEKRTEFCFKSVSQEQYLRVDSSQASSLTSCQLPEYFRFFPPHAIQFSLCPETILLI